MNPAVYLQWVAAGRSPPGERGAAKSTIAESAGYAIKASYLETFLKNVEGFEFPTLVNSMKDKPFTEKVADWKNYIFIVETN